MSRKDPSSRQAELPRWAEPAVLIHLAVLIVGLSWAFGGESAGARRALHLWGSAGIALTLALLTIPRGAGMGRIRRETAWRLAPLFAFDLLVLASAFNPSTSLVTRGGESYLLFTNPPHAWLPSSARPAHSLSELWQLNGIVISCANAFLFVRRRRSLRLLLAIVAGNALALAIFGTFQKLTGATGLWFGLVPSPQPLFFATFIYHNHWGAFTLLNCAACLALLFHAWQKSEHRDFWHSPVLTGAIGLLFLAASIPLSASRSSTVLAALLLFGGLAHALWLVLRSRRRARRPIVLPLLALIAGTLLATGATAFLGRRVIAERVRLTNAQLASDGTNFFGVKEDTYLQSRQRLYRDTWRMAMAHPYTGWGLETYGDVFRLYNTAPHVPGDQFRPWFDEAHNDWLQSIAETGFVGTALLLALALLPLLAADWRTVTSPIPVYLLAGCAFVAAYAWLEFPFANPSVTVGFWSNLYLAARYAVLDRRPETRQTSAPA